MGFEAMHGDKERLLAIRVDMRYRLEFELDEGNPEPMITMVTLQEFSNHYK